VSEPSDEPTQSPTRHPADRFREKLYRTTVVQPSWIWMLPPVVAFNASQVAGQATILVGAGIAFGSAS
jgi:hypothetical protein